MDSSAKKLIIFGLIAIGIILFLNWIIELKNEDVFAKWEKESFEEAMRIGDSLNKIEAEEDKRRKYWSRDSMLTWADFMANKDTNYADSAGICPIIEYKYRHIGPDTIKITVQAYMRKDLSWVKRGNEDTSLLRHEQGHFNLFEVYAREVRKKILSARLEPPNWSLFDEKNHSQPYSQVKNALNKILEDEYIKMKFIQDKYDSLTNHSINANVQKEWDKIIFMKLG